MVSKAVKVRLGIFITLGFGLIVLFFVLVAGNRLGDKRDIYYIEFANYSVSGIQVGGAVNYQGIKVGRVEDIRINPKDVTKVIMRISLDGGTPIKENTEAVLVFVGITGIKAVELRGGTNQAKTIPPGSYIKAGVSAVDDIADRAMSLADKIDEIAKNLANLTDDENRKNIADILKQTSLLIQDTRANLSVTISSISKLSESAASITSRVSTELDGIGENLNRSMNELTQATTRNIDRIGGTASNAIDSISVSSQRSLLDLTRELNSDILRITNNLDKTINDVNSQTVSLLKDTQFQINSVGKHSDQMILDTTLRINEISMNINRSLESVNKLIASPELDSILVNVKSLSGKLSEANTQDLVQELTTAVRNAGNLMGNLDRTLIRSRSNLYEMIESLREASENLNDFSKQISDTPSILWRSN